MYVQPTERQQVIYVLYLSTIHQSTQQWETKRVNKMKKDELTVGNARRGNGTILQRTRVFDGDANKKLGYKEYSSIYGQIQGLSVGRRPKKEILSTLFYLTATAQSLKQRSITYSRPALCASTLRSLCTKYSHRNNKTSHRFRRRRGDVQPIYTSALLASQARLVSFQLQFTHITIMQLIQFNTSRKSAKKLHKKTELRTRWHPTRRCKNVVHDNPELTFAPRS